MAYLDQLPARKYHITYSREGEHTALCELENYIPTRVGDGFWNFTYHFTDDDYEYARKHGELIEAE